MKPTELKNDRFLRALRCEPCDRPPIWVMRQAGRYLPEYRKTRSQATDFIAFCRNKDLATEATLQPLARFELDAAIVFSDILTVPDAMGCPVRFEPGVGPLFDRPIRDADSVQKLSAPCVADTLGYVGDVVSSVKQALAGRVPLIGFAGSPFTVACYMTEGSGSKQFLTWRGMMYRAPEIAHTLLSKITSTTIDYLIMQAQAGADVLMLFDSWGGLLSPEAYDCFSLHYMKQIVTALQSNPATKDKPLILFSKQAHHAYEKLANTGCQGLGVDWSIDIGAVRQRLAGRRVALQGNLDPAVLLSTPDTVALEAKKVLNAYGTGPGHIMNLGHGIDKETPIENMAALVETVTSHNTHKTDG